MANMYQSSLQDGSTLEKLTWTPLDHIEKVYRSPWYLIHRVDLHEELKRLAVGREGAGAPIVLRTSSRVVGIVSLANFQVDLVLVDDISVRMSTFRP